MNVDEKFNYYAEIMASTHGECAAKALATAMSQMLEAHCTERLIWQYAQRQISQLRSKEQLT